MTAIGNIRVNHKYPNQRGHFEADSKSEIPGRKKIDGNIEAGDNVKSWISTTNHEGISGDLEEIFSDRNRRIKRADAGDGN